MTMQASCNSAKNMPYCLKTSDWKTAIFHELLTSIFRRKEKGIVCRQKCFDLFIRIKKKRASAITKVKRMKLKEISFDDAALPNKKKFKRITIATCVITMLIVVRVT